MVKQKQGLIRGVRAFCCAVPLISLLCLQTDASYAQTTETANGMPEMVEPVQIFTNMRLIHTIKAYNNPVESLTFSPDGTILVSGGSTNEPIMRFWSVRDGKEIGAVRAQSSAVLALAVTPNGQLLISSGEDDDIHFWDPYSRENRGVFLDHYGNILDLAITPDSKVAISGGLDGIRVWTINPSRLLYELTDFGNPSYALAIHPNAYVLASGNNQGQVQFWNIRDGNLIAQFFPHEDTITDLAITADGQQLITASADRTVKVWDIPTGALVHTFEGHTSVVRAIALSPDSKLLATASNDGIRIWNFQEKRLFKYITYLEDWAKSLAFSEDGRYLVSGGNDGIINIWEFDTYTIKPSSPEPTTETPETPDIPQPEGEITPVTPPDDIIIEEE